MLRVRTATYNKLERSAYLESRLKKSKRKDVFCNFPINIHNFLYKYHCIRNYRQTAESILRSRYNCLSYKDYEENDYSNNIETKKFLKSLIKNKNKLCYINWKKEEYDIIRNVFWNRSGNMPDITLKGLIKRVEEKGIKQFDPKFWQYPDDILSEYKAALKVLKNKLENEK